MTKQFRVKARNGRQVYGFREYVDEDGAAWLESLGGIKSEPIGLEFVDTWTDVTFPARHVQPEAGHDPPMPQPPLRGHAVLHASDRGGLPIGDVRAANPGVRGYFCG